MAEIRTSQGFPNPPFAEKILPIFAQEPEGGRQGSVYDALPKAAEESSATALEVPMAEVEERLRRLGGMVTW